jgi:asparagine synthase (glutamine-hydrolysing)
LSLSFQYGSGEGPDRASATASAFYSHAIRWNNTARIRRFMLQQNEADKHLEEELVPIPRDFARWSHLGQAQYLEIVTFLSSYLLSSQGDRVAMAHSVEGRFPERQYLVPYLVLHRPR